jgi:hypothetical protein
MTNLEAYVVSDSNNSILTELDAKDAKSEVLEDEVRDLTTRGKSLISELNKAERKAYSRLGN